MKRRIAKAAEAFRLREGARSEVVRSFWPLRMFVLRAGELTGHGDDVFFLSIDELLALLRGDESALAHVPARRAAYAHYRALPTYPALIRGHFDPERWAADPARRSDVFDERGQAAPASARAVAEAATAAANLLLVILSSEDWAKRHDAGPGRIFGGAVRRLQRALLYLAPETKRDPARSFTVVAGSKIIPFIAI